ncbi:MAG: PorV/PorQ family protein [bacterium]
MKCFLNIIFLIILLTANIVLAVERVKLAQTGMQFLSVTSDARAAGMGRSVTTFEMQSSSLFYNPAGIAGQLSLFDISISRNNWIAGIYYNAISLSIAPAHGRYGVFGISLLTVNYGDVQGTVRADNEQGYLKTEMLKPTAYSIGLGYARSLTDKFSVGGHVKIVHQNLGKSVSTFSDSTLAYSENKITPVAFDFGTRFRTGFKSLIFGMSVRNFSPEVKYVSESFQLPLEFSIGVSMNAFDFIGEAEYHSLLLSLDAVHYRSHPEQINMGMEYTFREMILLRFGYRSGNNENNVNFGFGLQYSEFAIDYAYTPFGVFNDVQRFTIRFSL